MNPLSVILENFNDMFGNIDWKDADGRVLFMAISWL